VIFVMVNNSTNINKNHLPLQLIEWWSTIPLISTKSPITSTHWVMVNNSTNINKNHLSPQLIEWWSTWYWWNCWPSLNELRWEVIFFYIGGIVDHHSMSWVERWFKNHLSPQYIEWWSTIPPISTKITSHLITLSDGQQFHQYQQKSPLTLTHWVMVGDSCWFWWNCWLSLNELNWEVICGDIGGIVDHHNINKITSHLNSLSDGQQFHQYQQKSPLTSTHWVMVNNSTNINKNHLSLQPSFNELKWDVIFVDIGGIVDHHSMSWGERWFLLIMVELLTSLNELNSLSDGQQFHQYQQKSHLTSTHWMMVNNSTNINKNHLSPQLIQW
jgi:hypothetical protein